jgi:hypothetical protein
MKIFHMREIDNGRACPLTPKGAFDTGAQFVWFYDLAGATTRSP